MQLEHPLSSKNGRRHHRAFRVIEAAATAHGKNARGGRSAGSRQGARGAKLRISAPKRKSQMVVQLGV